MKKPILVASASVAILAVLGLSVLGVQSANQTSNRKLISASTGQAKAIKYSTDGKTVSYRGEANKTALEVLKSLTKVNTKTSSYGELVNGINGVVAVDSSEYWAFYVNGKLADTGAGAFKTTTNDQIQWRLVKL